MSLITLIAYDEVKDTVSLSIEEDIHNEYEYGDILYNGSETIIVSPCYEKDIKSYTNILLMEVYKEKAKEHRKLYKEFSTVNKVVQNINQRLSYLLHEELEEK